MSDEARDPNEQLVSLIRQCLAEGQEVDLEGVGVLRLGQNGSVQFLARSGLKVFISYIRQDADLAERLHEDLERLGFTPWLDTKRLLPGQNWKRSIEQAISVSDYFIPCYSSRALHQRSMFHHEVRIGLRCAAEMPFDDVFVMPVRLEDCRLPVRLTEDIQHVDMFPDWERGIKQLEFSLLREAAARRRRITEAEQ